MTNLDYDYLNKAISSFKECIIRNAERNGSTYQRFQIFYDDIKNQTNRMRLAQSVIAEYIAFLENQGFDVRNDSVSIMVEVDLNRTFLTPSDAQNLADALYVYNHKDAQRFSSY